MTWFEWASTLPLWYTSLPPLSLRKASEAAADSVVLIIHWVRAVSAAFAVLDNTDCSSPHPSLLYVKEKFGINLTVLSEYCVQVFC